jgi:hypothetical protein
MDQGVTPRAAVDGGARSARRVALAGAPLLVSGDRDVAGEQITAELLAAYSGAEQWRPDLLGLFEGGVRRVRRAHAP